MLMGVYLAAAFERQPELLGYAQELELLKIDVTSRWLTFEKPMQEYSEDKFRRNMAMIDEMDVVRADVLVLFSHPRGKGPSSGGRHVEYGMARVAGNHIFVVGPKENIFHYLPGVRHFETWDACKAALIEMRDTLFRSELNGW